MLSRFVEADSGFGKQRQGGGYTATIGQLRLGCRRLRETTEVVNNNSSRTVQQLRRRILLGLDRILRIPCDWLEFREVFFSTMNDSG